MARDVKKAQDLVGKGAEAHQAGQFDRAEKFYKRALKADGQNADSLHLLGLISHQKGRDEYAAQLINKAIALKPQEPAFNTNLAIVLNALSRWPEAEQASTAAIKAVPDHAEAYNNLGRALAAQNKSVEAEAAYDKAIEFAPNNAAAENNLGHLHMKQGRYELAEAAFLRSIEIDGTFLLAFSNLATTYMAMDWLDRAEEVCRTALKIDPNFVPALHSLGIVLTRTKQLDGAEALFKQVIELASDHSQAVSNLASVLSSQARFEEALPLFRKAIQIQPNNSHAHINLGVCYSELGQMDEALTSLRTALVTDPNNVDAYYALSTSGKEKLDQTELNFLTAILNGERFALTPDQKTKILFTMAMQSDRRGEAEQSFDWYEKANTCRVEVLSSEGKVFDAKTHDQEINRLIEFFDKNFFASRKGRVNENVADQTSPIFVIGMPRSGTTLAEQIIAAHSNAVGGGELPDIGAYIRAFRQAVGEDTSFPESVAFLAPEQIREWAELYSAKLARLGAGAAYVVDKTPFNFSNLWLIQMMYPKAKVIHCQRDAIDTGLSCFQQNFVQPHPWSCDLNHIGSFTNAYRRLMSHWQETLSLSILNVVYEDVVADPEEQSRRIIKYLGLEWQGGVLDFHQSENKVKTASKWQVREPIYQRSVGRWQKYETQLKPLIDALD